MKLFITFLILTLASFVHAETLDAEAYLEGRIAKTFNLDALRIEAEEAKLRAEISNLLGSNTSASRSQDSHNGTHEYEHTTTEVPLPTVLRVVGNVVVYSYGGKPVPVRVGEFIGGFQLTKMNENFIILRDSDGTPYTQSLL